MLGDNSKQLLLNFILSLERLQAERATLGEDMRDIYATARDLHGFNIPAMREILRIRREDPQKRAAHEELVETYREALGMTPLEEAIERSRTADPPFLTGGEDQ